MLSQPLISTLAVTLVIFTIIWRIHVSLGDAGIVDYYWGPGFLVIAGIWMSHTSAAPLILTIFLAFLALWGLRLTAHLVIRHRKFRQEDSRYTAMRERGGKSWWIRSLFTVFWLQAIILWAVASPVHALMSSSPEHNVAWPAAVIGSAFFVIGFLFESIGDLQLSRFRDDPNNEGKLLTTGLRAWCRYPSYFGESVLWWGMGLIAYAASASPWAFAGPLLLTFLLLKVSGVAMLDGRLKSRKGGYEDWIYATNAFIPWPPKESQSTRNETPEAAE
nr:DUF1295 domain-containing protein [Hongsoonwoonella zoysiae]